MDKDDELAGRGMLGKAGIGLMMSRLKRGRCGRQQWALGMSKWKWEMMLSKLKW